IFGSVIGLVSASIGSWKGSSGSASSFHPPQGRPFAFERGFDMGASPRQARHYGSDRYALDLGDFAVAHSFEHHEQQHRALLLGQRGERAGDVAALSLGAAGVGIIVEKRHQYYELAMTHDFSEVRKGVGSRRITNVGKW